MKMALCVNYPLRSLVRGGKHTFLAIACIAVAIMGLVTLQLTSSMVQSALLTNVRDSIGGDIYINAIQPFSEKDLNYFTTLEKDATIANYTPSVQLTGAVSLHNSGNLTFFVQFVDPSNYPIVTPPTLSSPAGGSIKNLLKGNQVIVDQSFIDQYHLKIGDSFDVHAASFQQQSLTFHVRIAGIVTGTLARSSTRGLVLASLDEYRATKPSTTPLLYDTVFVTTPDTDHTSQVKSLIQDRFPYAETWIPEDLLSQQRVQAEDIKKGLAIAGLLVLLVGCLGFISTMQVFLLRRQHEIATLKTMGYAQRDLYLLLGAEAGLSGLFAGIIGAGAAVGVSYLIRGSVIQMLQVIYPFTLDPVIIGEGVLIGVAAALIFGVLPIVQQVHTRPLEVLRDQPEVSSTGSIVSRISLLLVLSVLFCGLAIAILNSASMAVESVYGILAGLALLSLFLGLVAWLVGKLPIPNRQHRNYTIALRTIGRQRGSAITTMLALFVALFTIGITTQIGQSMRADYSTPHVLHYNLVAITSGDESSKLQAQLNSVPGLSAFQHTTLAQTVPVSINGTLFTSVWKGSQSAQTSSPYDLLLDLVSGVEGFDVKNNQVPSTQDFQITGRNLNASDAGTDNALVDFRLAGSKQGAAQLHIGDKIILENADRSARRTITIVGFYRTRASAYRWFPILTTSDTTRALQPLQVDQSVFYMRLDPAKVSAAIDAIGAIAPNAYVQDQTIDNQLFYQQSVDNTLSLLMIPLILVLLVAVLIIANTIALSTFKRRRELGVLKTLGYTSSSIFRELLIENGVVSAVSAVLAGILVVAFTTQYCTSILQIQPSINALTVGALIVGATLLVIGVTALTAWGSVRVRPLEVLRYE